MRDARSFTCPWSRFFLVSLHVLIARAAVPLSCLFSLNFPLFFFRLALVLIWFWSLSMLFVRCACLCAVLSPGCLMLSIDVAGLPDVFKTSRRHTEVRGSSCFWFQQCYPSSCSWDKTLAARPREILRSINKLQTQLNRGGFAGFEVSLLCKSMSSCFVLIPRKASISMSSPVVAWIVRWAVLVIFQRHSFLCSGTSCLEFANLVSLPNYRLSFRCFSTELPQLLSLALQPFWDPARRHLRSCWFASAYCSASFSSEFAVRYIWCEACGLIPSTELAE